MVANRFLLKRHVCLVTGLTIMTVVISLFLAYRFRLIFANDKMPDPDSPLPPSSMPMGLYKKFGVVSNGGPCAQIGVDVITKGGNAVDAAIATMLCDGVLCPEFMGMGGGFFMTVYNATTKRVKSINAREKAPAAAHVSMFAKNPLDSVRGGLAVGVPGELKGYSKIYELYGGGVSWESLFEPTIRLCEQGMKVSQILGHRMADHEDLIKNDTLLSEIFLDETTGHVKKTGETYKLPKLAITMRIVAKHGADALYNGSLTSRFLNDLKKINSIITQEDLENYEVEVVESFSVKLKGGYTIHSAPPPSSGIILAYILRVLEGILPAPDRGLNAHRLVEAFKYGYAERTHLGDHRFVNVSGIFDKVNSDDYVNSIRRKISDDFTSSDPKHYGADFDMVEDHGTANMVAIDSAGNVVVATSTINTIFGSGIVSPSTGIILNNQMDDFSTPGVANTYGFQPSPANFIKPGKRPMSSMCPTIFTDENGDFLLGVGGAGGSKITLATAYVSALKLWCDKTLKEALDEPRIYHQLMPMIVQYEYGTTKDVVQKLKDIGHPVVRLKQSGVSQVSAISVTSSKMIEAMPDFRRPGNSSGL